MINERAAALLDRYARLKSDRSTWEAHWRDVASYVIPRKDHIGGDAQNRGEKKKAASKLKGKKPTIKESQDFLNETPADRAVYEAWLDAQRKKKK